MRVYEASTRISAEFGGIRDLSRHLSLNLSLSLSFLSVLLVARLWRRGRLLREHAELVQGEAVHRATETDQK